MFNIESCPNTNYAGVYYIVVYTVAQSAKMVDAKIPFQRFSSSSTMFYTLNVHMMLPIV